MSMTNVIKENNFIIYMLNIGDFKDELDALDKIDWKEEKYIATSFVPSKQLTYDPDTELRRVKRLMFGDLATPSCLPNASNRNHHTGYFARDVITCIIDKLKKYYKKPIQHRGTYSYHPGSRCGWHTNSNSPGKRIYFTWTEEDNKSFFKYLDNETDQIITKYDKKGWHINEFIIPKEGVFWHYVGSETCRKSIGFLISL